MRIWAANSASCRDRAVLPFRPASNALHQWARRPMAAQRRFSPTDGMVAVPKFEGDTPMTPGGSLREWPGRSAGSGWGPAPQGHRGSGLSRRAPLCGACSAADRENIYQSERFKNCDDKLAFLNWKRPTQPAASLALLEHENLWVENFLYSTPVSHSIYAVQKRATGLCSVGFSFHLDANEAMGTFKTQLRCSSIFLAFMIMLLSWL